MMTLASHFGFSKRNANHRKYYEAVCLRIFGFSFIVVYHYLTTPLSILALLYRQFVLVIV